MQDDLPKESPFSPGKPVPVEYFVARRKEIERLERAIQQTASGRNENIFIEGERGIGKSSLARFIRYLAGKNHDMIGCHCLLGGVKDLEGVMQVVFQRLLEQVSERSLSETLKKIFAKHIKGVTLFGVGIDFTDDPSELRALVNNFLPAIRKVCDAIKVTQRKGLILILDDLNGITRVPEFSHFLKSTVDGLAISHETLPLLLVLVGTPERREELIKHQPSVGRIFDIVSLTPMDNNESKQFFESAFGKKNVEIDSDAMSDMVDFSGGFPMLMHEIGNEVFWQDVDHHVDSEDATNGIISAAKNVGKKYLDPQVYRTIRSDTYRSILRKMGQLDLGTRFQRKVILEKVTETERKTFDNFLKKMKKLGVIHETEVRGEYEFTNQLYHLYVGMEAFKVTIQVSKITITY